MGCSSPSAAYADVFEGHWDLLRSIAYSPDLLACKMGSCKSVTPHTEPSMLWTTLASRRRAAQCAVMQKLSFPTTSGLLGFARASRFAKPFFPFPRCPGRHCLDSPLSLCLEITHPAADRPPEWRLPLLSSLELDKGLS